MQKDLLPIVTGAFLMMIFMLCMPHYSCATEEYAKQTGRACSTCHLDQAGGGELTAAGKKFAATFHSAADDHIPGVFGKILRLVAGYIHFLTAVFWFGTILYVHLVLKPAYAAGGLPRGELRVGIVSMVVMGLSGAVLTFYRINSLDSLIHTRFGILLVIKVFLYLVMVVSAVIVITVIGPRLKAKRKEPLPAAMTGSFSAEELASCDGKEGQPACFAFEGKIYDATQSLLWKQGVHMGRHNAGIDLTDALKLAPHGPEKLSAMRVVGVLSSSGPRKTALHERVFYFMSYMNLSIVLIIILILALWRWG